MLNHRTYPMAPRLTGERMVGHSELDVLMGKLADGERDAFSPLFRALWPPALKLCERMLEGRADAADAAQEAMMRILERASEYDKNRPALPWALGIAAWECRTIAKRQQRLKETQEKVTVSDEGSGAHDLEQKLLESAALHAMGSLMESEQQTLFATYWETGGDVSGPTFRKRRQRALKRLRDVFRRLYGLD